MWGPLHLFFSLKKLATFFRACKKFTAPFVGPLFVGAPVRPNMLNMPKSAAVLSLLSFRLVMATSTTNLNLI